MLRWSDNRIRLRSIGRHTARVDKYLILIDFIYIYKLFIIYIHLVAGLREAVTLSQCHNVTGGCIVVTMGVLRRVVIFGNLVNLGILWSAWRAELR